MTVEHKAAARALAGLAAAVLTIVVIPAAIVAETANESGHTWWWAMITVVIAGGRLAVLIQSGERRLYEMTFWVFTYTFMGLAPMTQIRENRYPETVPRLDTALIPEATAVVVIGCVAFLLGVCCATRIGVIATADNRSESAIQTVSARKLLVLSVFAIAFNAYYLAKLGIIQFTQSREATYAAYDVVWKPGSLGVLVRACTFMSLLVAWLGWIRYRREMRALGWPPALITARQRRTSLVFAVIIGVLLANSMNPISNARYLSGTAILAAAMAFGCASSRGRFRAMVVWFVLALVVVFPMADAFRYSDSAQFKSSNPLESLTSADYDSFGQITNGLLIAHRDPITPGRQFLGVLLWWFPRSHWANKPQDTGILLADGRGYSMTNLSAPLWIELFLNGGWVLLVVAMAALGFFFHRADSRIELQMQLTSMPSVLGSVLPFYLLILLRGSLLQAMSYLMFIVVFVWWVSSRASLPDPAMPVGKVTHAVS